MRGDRTRFYVTGPDRNTPLFAWTRLSRAEGVTLLGQGRMAEIAGGSVKDRAASAMVRDARTGKAPGRARQCWTQAAATPGLRLACWRGARVSVYLAMPSMSPRTLKRILKAYGAHMSGPTRTRVRTERSPRSGAGRKEPERFLLLGSIPRTTANWKAHYESTREEIWRQSDGRVLILWPDGHQRHIHGIRAGSRK